jgi:DNA-binding transcriptional ArsR family regulator
MAATARDESSLCDVFAALADPVRLDIVTRLCDGDATVSEIGVGRGISKQAISKHLQVLERAGVISRPGNRHRSPVHLETQVFDLMTKWVERYRREAEHRYRKLDTVLASMKPRRTESTDGERS